MGSRTPVIDVSFRGPPCSSCNLRDVSGRERDDCDVTGRAGLREMAPVMADCSVSYTTKLGLCRRDHSRERGVGLHRLARVRSNCCVITASPCCPSTADHGQRRRRRRPAVPLHLRSSSQGRRLLRRSTAAAAAAAADDDDDADEAPASRVSPAPALRKSNVQQRQLMTVLYRAATVDQLALRLSRLQLQTDVIAKTSSAVDDNTRPLSSSLDSDHQPDVVLAVRASADCRQQQVDGSSPRPQPTSMIELLRRSTRIPRPVATHSHRHTDTPSTIKREITL